MSKPLEGKVALVAGATRGAGRGIARCLGEAGAKVWCTGRSVRGRPATEGRAETVDETADLIREAGGRAVAVQVDHTVPQEVEALVARIEREEGTLDVLVNDVWGGDALTEWGKPFFELSLDKGRLLLERGVASHVITARSVAPLMVRARKGLIVEVGDGEGLHYRGSFFYDLAKVAVLRVAFALAEELRPHGVTALSVTPGFLRSEAVLDHFGVSEATWRDAVAKDAHFAESETPFYIGRGIAALAADPRVARKSGRALTSAGLAREYGFTDVDGRAPNWPRHFAAHFPEALSVPFP